MKNVSLLALLCVLSACGTNNYTMANGHPITSQDKYNSDFDGCKEDAYNKSRAQCPTCQYLGLMGAIVDAQTNTIDVNKEIQTCMIGKGYRGTTSGYSH